MFRILIKKNEKLLKNFPTDPLFDFVLINNDKTYKLQKAYFT